MTFFENNLLDLISNYDQIFEQFNIVGLSVKLRSTDKFIWENTLISCEYAPVAYTNMNIDFLFEHQKGNDIEIHDISTIIYWDNKPVAIWPLFLSFKEENMSLNFLDNCVIPPLFISSCQLNSKKQIIKSCLNFLNNITKLAKQSEWKSMDSFTNNLGLSIWHEVSMSYGAKSFLEHELFIDLNLPLIEIKSKIRKSFKSLITAGQKLWKVEVMEGENIKIWEDFKDLHIKVAGRKTRSDKTWEIHYKDICQNNSFLIYLLDNNNEMVGGGLFQFTKDEALYAVAAYDRNLFDKPLGHVIQFRAIEELKKRTASWYKLGGRPFLNGQTTPTEKEIKIAEFKHGFASHLFSRIVLIHSLI